MSYSEILADRIREVLYRFGMENVEEKKMFGSLAFMVRGKMCVTCGPGRMMCRISPEDHDEALERPGCSAMGRRGKSYRGFVYVDEDYLQDQEVLEAWIDEALRFNQTLTE